MVDEPIVRGSFTVVRRDDGSKQVEEHIEFMRLAIMQANLAAPDYHRFNTGIMIVKNLQPLSTGHSRDKHAPSLHAAANAIAKARHGPRAHLLVGSTMYTTMEPCSSTIVSKIPCTTHIINARIKKVVIGVKEPESFVNCKGVETLRTAGIDVVHMQMLQEECLKTNIHLLT